MPEFQQFASPVRGIQGRHGFLLYNQYCHYVGRALELYGEYCEHEVALFAQLIRPTDVVWELGANTGSQSVALARLASRGKYVGVEPQVELFKIFTANLALNNCDNALPLCMALGDQTGLVNLPPVDYQRPNNFGGISLLETGNVPGQQVELRRIDDLHWMPAPNFIKIDVEGMETQVLLGAEKTLRALRPTLYIENDRPQHSRKLLQVLQQLGYKAYWHITPYFNEANYFNNSQNIYGNVVSLNMICVQPGSHVNVVGAQEIGLDDRHPLER